MVSFLRNVTGFTDTLSYAFDTVQKKKFSIKDFFRSLLQI